jgi:hypothetical protein
LNRTQVIAQGFHATVVANRFLRCSGSRESIHTLIQALWVL